jgi:hypothetical protein
MRVLRMAVVAAATMALLTTPASAAPAGTATADFVVGGGLRIGPDGVVPNRTFSVDARTLPNGEVSGHYTFLVRGANAHFTGDVTCVEVVGNHAVIGGRITTGNLGAGEDFLVFFIDNGDPVGGQFTPDIVSVTPLTSEGFWPSSDIPSDFPATCPDADGDAHDRIEYRDVQGNLAVNDGN